MRTPQRMLNRRQTSFIQSVSAPTGGLNARDPIAAMDPEDAVILNNFFCTPYDVMTRKGYSKQTSGLPGTVETLISYTPSVSASSKLYAFSSGNVYDVSAAGPVGSPVIAGNSSDTFQHATYGTAGGIFMIAVSGSDLPLVYNGTVWSNVFSAAFITTVTSLTSVGTTATCVMANPHNLKTGMSVTITGFTPAGYNGTYVITVTNTTTFTFTLSGALGVVTVTGAVAPTINLTVTGVDPATFIQIVPFKARIWAVQKDTCKAWYMPAVSIGGAAAVLDLSSFFTRGGYLQSMTNWSLDAGQGMDDYVVFISSRGQAVVYRGTDPASSATFSLVGVFDIGSPIGIKCFTKLAGDVLIICQDGLVPLSQALMSTRVNSKIALTDKVRDLVGNYITDYDTLTGWEAIVFPKGNMLLLNIPTSTTTATQFVMNTISRQWSTFTGWNARCWALHNDEIYFGGDTVVCRAWDTYADDGVAINFEALQSFNYFGSSAQLKQVKMVRPIISTDGAPALVFGVNVDFDQTAPSGTPTFSPATIGTWDVSVWDTGMWGGALSIKKDWQNVSGIGYCVAAHILGQLSGCTLRWSSTDYMMQNGGMI